MSKVKEKFRYLYEGYVIRGSFDFVFLCCVLLLFTIGIIMMFSAGYVIWNHYPAKVMMGDTGSMFLGGIIVALAYAIECPLILLPIGIVYVIEALSDVIQIGSIKIRHKKVFKMAPIHHHFEMCGWSEKKIVRVFTLVSTIGCIIGVAAMYFTIK